MDPRALLAAALAAVCILEACDAFRANHIHPPSQTNSHHLGPYYANYSLVGQEVECSGAAKRCLAINKLLHEPSGICYQLGDFRPCDEGAIVLDAESFKRGQLRSRCGGPSTCKAYKMAYDGKCYEWRDANEKLCDGIGDLLLHPFGGFECNTVTQKRERVKAIRQPKSPGRCIVPNLQNADIGSFWVECSIAEEECLKQELLPFRGSCHAPLSNTPCPEGQWLVLDEVAAENGRLSVKCVSSRPCGFNAQLLRADGSCHANTELFEELCKGNYIIPFSTGDYICSLQVLHIGVQGLRNANGSCEVDVLPLEFDRLISGIQVTGMNCVFNDQLICQPKVQSPNSKPDLASEY